MDFIRFPMYLLIMFAGIFFARGILVHYLVNRDIQDIVFAAVLLLLSAGAIVLFFRELLWHKPDEHEDENN